MRVVNGKKRAMRIKSLLKLRLSGNKVDGPPKWPKLKALKDAVAGPKACVSKGLMPQVPVWVVSPQAPILQLLVSRFKVIAKINKLLFLQSPKK